MFGAMTVLDLREPWRELLERRRGFAASLTPYGEIVERWATATTAPAGAWSAERCRQTWTRGLPIAAESAPPLDADDVEDLLGGIMEQLAATPYDEMISGDVVWVGTPQDVIERIEQTIEVCEGLSEVAITVNPGGIEHWKAIKTQELFADRVMPNFGRESTDTPQSVGAR